MNSKKLIIVLLGVFITNLAVADPLFSLSLGERNLDFFLGLGMDLQFNTPPIKGVKNVSESIRNISIHGDDSWGYPGPIAKDNADAPWLTEIRFLKFGVETKLNHSTVWKSYLDLSWNYGHWVMWGADINRRNYTNASGTDRRGYGAALTFWSPGYDQFIPGLRTELLFNNNWLIGAGFRRFNLQILRGHDRYDRLDHKTPVDIGKISETSLYIALIQEMGANTYGDYRIGLNFNSYDGKSSYREIDVDLNKTTLFFAINLCHRF